MVPTGSFNVCSSVGHGGNGGALVGGVSTFDSGGLYGGGSGALYSLSTVSYTHLTLPTTERV